MSDVITEDASAKDGDMHYTVTSFNSKLVDEQYRMQPKYCEVGEVGGGLQGAKSNKQVGP
jgi:hypothetical protein